LPCKCFTVCTSPGPDYPGQDKKAGTRNVDVKLSYFDLLPHHTTLAHLLGFFKRVSVSRSRELRLSGTETRDEETRAQVAEEWGYNVKVGEDGSFKVYDFIRESYLYYFYLAFYVPWHDYICCCQLCC
jgi:hypothetical protein